jgi:hypothetical protein
LLAGLEVRAFEGGRMRRSLGDEVRLEGFRELGELGIRHTSLEGRMT